MEMMNVITGSLRFEKGSGAHCAHHVPREKPMKAQRKADESYRSRASWNPSKQSSDHNEPEIGKHASGKSKIS